MSAATSPVREAAADVMTQLGELLTPPSFEQQQEEQAAQNSTALRKGNISSARFNMLCTMVGGGCLSLPMAFQKSGSALMAPVILLVFASITYYTFQLITETVRKLSPVSANERFLGKDSFESMTSAAFGGLGFVLAKIIVLGMCFFGALGYCILLRDMLEPVIDHIFHLSSSESSSSSSSSSSSWVKNSGMVTVVLLMTPVCTMETLSPLKNLGAASMSSVALLSVCVVYRSLQCNLGYYDGETHGSPWSTMNLWPTSAREVLDAIPVFVYCYACHYNLPLVHNELMEPTKERVSWWHLSTVVPGTLFYIVLGYAGAAYGHCTASGEVQGNILLDFDENDPLLLVARLCLSLTIAMAFPLQVIPARDILLRSFCAHPPPAAAADGRRPRQADLEGDEFIDDDDLGGREPLLSDYLTTNDDDGEESGCGYSFRLRSTVAILVFWTAALIASTVEHIAIVWDLLGSSFSILSAFLIPAGSYLVIVHRNAHVATREMDWVRRWTVLAAWTLLVVFTPLMILSTINAVVHTLYDDP